MRQILKIILKFREKKIGTGCKVQYPHSMLTYISIPNGYILNRIVLSEQIHKKKHTEMMNFFLNYQELNLAKKFQSKKFHFSILFCPLEGTLYFCFRALTLYFYIVNRQDLCQIHVKSQLINES